MKYYSQFLLDKEKGKEDAKLRYRIKWNDNKNIIAVSLGYRVDIKKWSLETQRCKANTTHGKKKVSASIINKKIQRYEDICRDLFLDFRSEKKEEPSEEEFKERFNLAIDRYYPKRRKQGRANGGNVKNFFQIIDEYQRTESVKRQWSKGTTQKITTLKNHLINFDDELNFSSFTEDRLYDLIFWLQNELNFKNQSALKIISLLKGYLKWATKAGYKVNNAFETFTPKLKNAQKKIIFLTPTELNQLKNFNIPDGKQYLERVRDVFLFQCFTGLRYSDVFNLKKSEVKNQTIEITTLKTVDRLIIELNNHSQSILDKYKNIDLEDDKALPVISNQRMNEYLKELAELAEIDDSVRETYYIGNRRIDTTAPKYALLGTHAGRRTFICNALSLGIPPQVIMKWTGHKDYKAMKPYIDIADETKVNAMERFNNL